MIEESVIALVIIATVCLIVYLVYCFIAAYWVWVLAAIGVLVLIAIFAAVFCRESEEQKSKRIALENETALRRQQENAKMESDIATARQAEQERIEESKRKFVRDFAIHLRPCLVIDSNIWMDSDYDLIFDFLHLAFRTHQYTLRLPGIQFDEITNIKNSTNFGDEKNQRARLAINRIDEFDRQGLLQIEKLSHDAKRGAYFDPEIVKMFAAQAKKGEVGTLISNDKELQIRVRGQFTDSQRHLLRILNADHLLSQCEQYYEVVNVFDAEESRRMQFGGEIDAPPDW